MGPHPHAFPTLGELHATLGGKGRCWLLLLLPKPPSTDSRVRDGRNAVLPQLPTVVPTQGRAFSDRPNRRLYCLALAAGSIKTTGQPIASEHMC